jgi:hypothetical protein
MSANDAEDGFYLLIVICSMQPTPSPVLNAVTFCLKRREDLTLERKEAQKEYAEKHHPPDGRVSLSTNPNRLRTALSAASPDQTLHFRPDGRTQTADWSSRIAFASGRGKGGVPSAIVARSHFLLCLLSSPRHVWKLVRSRVLLPSFYASDHPAFECRSNSLCWHTADLVTFAVRRFGSFRGRGHATFVCFPSSPFRT